MLAGPDTVPSLWGAALRLGLAVGAMAVTAGAWLLWQRRAAQGTRRQLEVLDRTILARGVSVVLLRAEKERLLVGVSQDGVRLIRRMADTPAAAANTHPFAEILRAEGGK